MAQIISVNVGKPKSLNWKGEIVQTSIFKHPVQGSVEVKTLNLVGDQQSDLKVHGGPDKAVYAYPSEHYEFWTNEINQDLPWGSFGENLTIRGFLEPDVRVGDILQVGSVTFQVTQPRFPCFKLGLKFNDSGMIKRFAISRRNGFYFRVLQEGELAAGDDMVLTSKTEKGILINDFLELYLGKEKPRALLEAAIGSPGIPQDWIGFFARYLKERSNADSEE